MAIRISCIFLDSFFWGMALFVLHAGEEEKREEGKKKMLWGIIAITIMFAIWGIVKFLQVGIFGSIVPGAPPGI